MGSLTSSMASCLVSLPMPTPYLRQVVEEVHREQVVEVLVLFPAEVPGQDRGKAIGKILERHLLLLVGINVARAVVLPVIHDVHAVPAPIPLVEELDRHPGGGIGVDGGREFPAWRKPRTRDLEVPVPGAVPERRTDGLGAVELQVVVLDLAVVVLGPGDALVVIVVDAAEEGRDGLRLAGGHAVDAHADQRAFVDLAEVEPERCRFAER